MKPSVYLETSIISYLASRPSRDLIVAANQQLTWEWWETRAGDFELYVSQMVIEECQDGDIEAAMRRMNFAGLIQPVEISQEVIEYAEEIVRLGILPTKAGRDAFHIAAATIHGLDYLLTWNCRHISNAIVKKKLIEYGYNRGYKQPYICTPLELLAGK